MDRTQQNNSNLDLQPSEPESVIADPQTSAEVYRSSLNSILSQNIGYYVVCEFLIGTNNIVIKDGVIYAVGINFLTLYQEEEDRYVMCDIYSLKFVNFYDSHTRPRNVRIPRNTTF